MKRWCFGFFYPDPKCEEVRVRASCPYHWWQLFSRRTRGGNSFWVNGLSRLCACVLCVQRTGRLKREGSCYFQALDVWFQCSRATRNLKKKKKQQKKAKAAFFRWKNHRISVSRNQKTPTRFRKRSLKLVYNIYYVVSKKSNDSFTAHDAKLEEQQWGEVILQTPKVCTILSTQEIHKN